MRRISVAFGNLSNTSELKGVFVPWSYNPWTLENNVAIVTLNQNVTLTEKTNIIRLATSDAPDIATEVS